MIKPEEVVKLAELARLEIAPEELEKIGHDLSAILDYVSELKEVTEPATGFDLGFPGADSPKLGPVAGGVNVWREDNVTHTSGEFSEQLLESASESKDQYFKVKKILG